MYKIYPSVKRIKISKDGKYIIKNKLIVFFNEIIENVFKKLKTFKDIELGKKENADIIYNKIDGLNDEAYEIIITPEKININYSKSVGAFYATVTLKQILNNDSIECLEIYDEPDLKVRGFMLDISRNKVMKLSGIKKLVDMLSDLKMNHFELYVEGFSFEYKSFKEYLVDEAYITKDEYQELEQYCQERYIDFVPNQNGFGHMAKWLEKDELKSLAEIEEGVFLWGEHRNPMTLNPLDPKSLDLVKKMYKDMLPYSKSKYFNMNFDEPFELGKGKSEKECLEKGVGNVYLDYTLKVYDEIKKYNKSPLIWGDVLIKHKDVLNRIPKDMIFIDWGYDATYPFRKNLKTLSDAKIKFMAAPGTTSWCSFTGRTLDWIEHINNSVRYVYEYGGEGVVLTDWGDFGHLQFLPFSYAPICYCASLCWRVEEGSFFNIKDYLNRYIFKDESKLICDLLYDLGNYYKYENGYMTNATSTFFTFRWMARSMIEDNPIEYLLPRIKNHIVTYEKNKLLYKLFDDCLDEVSLLKLKCDDSLIVIDEIKQTINLLKAITLVQTAFIDKVDKEEKIINLNKIIKSKEELITGYKRLWIERNKIGNLDDSIGYIDKFIECTKLIMKNITRGEMNET